MFFTKVYIYRDPAAEAGHPGDIACDLNGLRHWVEDTSPELRRLAEAEAEITVTAGTFEQDLAAPQQPYPGGTLTLDEFFVGRLALINCGDNDYWQFANGRFRVAAPALAASRQGKYQEYLADLEARNHRLRDAQRWLRQRLVAQSSN